MAQYEHLPIYKAAFDLVIYFEKIVAGFSRYNKYTHGKGLRDISRDIIMLKGQGRDRLSYGNYFP